SRPERRSSSSASPPRPADGRPTGARSATLWAHMDVLERSPLLRALPGAERLVPHLERLEHEPGATIVREGGSDRDLYLVLGGSARILRQGLDAGRLRAGDHFG